MDSGNIPLQSEEIARLQREIDDIRTQHQDLQIIYENTVEHGSELENELEEKNRHINQLLANMKKYLSPQLFDSIVRGRIDAHLSYQRRKLTIFFSDLVGFTEITDTLEPEALSECLNSYLSDMSQIALKYGGTIDKFVGDAILIFFGAPEFIDDKTHAEKAIHMALEMREHLDVLIERWESKGVKAKLQVRMGINTGFCTIGNFGSELRMDYTIIGGQVNLASRLQTFAQPNTIVISGSTFTFVRDIVESTNLGKIKVKGIANPVEVHEVLALRRGTGEPINPYLEKEENGFRLKNIRFDKGNARAEQIAQMRQAIQEAERLLDLLNADPGSQN